MTHTFWGLVMTDLVWHLWIWGRGGGQTARLCASLACIHCQMCITGHRVYSEESHWIEFEWMAFAYV